VIVGRGKYLFSDAVLAVLVYIVFVRRLWFYVFSFKSHLYTPTSPFSYIQQDLYH
jgi:hypothetical protein